jgi:riboflavin kinase / FMN adenylyltransferase
VVELPCTLAGIVEHGDERGRTIGFPTANIAIAAGVALPAEGVYAGWYTRPDGSRHMAAVNVGRRPTFYPENGALLVEAFLLDFEGDLYDEHARLEITHWLRGEERYDSVDDLVVQMHRDVDDARALLTEDARET